MLSAINAKAWLLLRCQPGGGWGSWGILPAINVEHGFFSCGISKEWVLRAHFGKPGQARQIPAWRLGGLGGGSHVWLRWRCWPRWQGELAVPSFSLSKSISEFCFSRLKKEHLNEHICGRPLGLRFDKKTGDLYIADAYFGLLKVGPEGGLATPVTTEAEGIPLKFTNDLDIDEDGSIYFTDSSTNYQRRNFMQLVFTGEPSGRLLKYNPVVKETTVLLRGLQFPNGVTLSKDGSFFLFCEGSRGRLSRYWLKGEKAGTSDVFAILPGFPDNVRTNEKGEFWVAIHCRRSMYTHLTSRYFRLRKFLLKLPIPVKYHFLLQIGGRPHAVIIKYSPDGELLEILEDSQGKVVRAVSEVEEKDGKLWIGSVLMPFIAVY
ncbi:Strictosidine synthase [Musa troglodytarum]|uniref:Strictosidine synthase n=1 Tax=Musa troglodytarum TaxID=320322 RepID=A0A9E7KND4_9LILI|nr:Strictosidine synthase [Musa troglodytarum]